MRGRATEITERGITLTCVSEVFIRAVEEMDRGRGRDREDWDDHGGSLPPLPPDAGERFRPAAAGDQDDDPDRWSKDDNGNAGHYC